MTFDPSIIRDPRQVRLYDYWRGKARDRAMPARADIDPIEFAWALGWVTLLRLVPPNDWQFDVDGSHIADSFGIDMTGKRLSEYPRQRVRTMLSNTYGVVASAREPLFVTRDVEHGFRRWRYDGLLLPLSDDGVRIDRLLSSVVLDDGAPA